MGMLKKLFKKSEEPTAKFSERMDKTKQIKNQLDAVFKDKRNKVCKLCEGPISDEERYTKQGGYFWHKKCWNKAKSMAKNTNQI